MLLTQEGCGELFDSGQEFLDRVAISLGGKALVPAAAALLPAWLQDAGDWRKRHAALICLAQIAEGCAKVMLEQLAPLVGMCLQGLNDAHARVRRAQGRAGLRSGSSATLRRGCTEGPRRQPHHTELSPESPFAMGQRRRRATAGPSSFGGRKGIAPGSLPPRRGDSRPGRLYS
jgi:hypothetical protein